MYYLLEWPNNQGVYIHYTVYELRGVAKGWFFLSAQDYSCISPAISSQPN
jgi:hypothetical protein